MNANLEISFGRSCSSTASVQQSNCSHADEIRANASLDKVAIICSTIGETGKKLFVDSRTFTPMRDDDRMIVISPRLSHERAREVTCSYNDLIAQFRAIILRLKNTSDPKSYGTLLKEAEDILTFLLEKIPYNLEEALSNIKVEFLEAYQNIPEGEGVLTRLEIDYIKNYSKIPTNRVCQNNNGVNYMKPHISINKLQAIFLSLGFTKVMHSREVANFEGNEGISDVIMLGKESDITSLDYIKRIAISALCGFYRQNDISEELQLDIDLLNRHFQRNGEAKKLGYACAKSFLITEIRDRSKAERLKEQGFQYCTVLDYPIINEHV